MVFEVTGVDELRPFSCKVDWPDGGEVTMSIVVRFPLSNVTKQQYDSAHAALEQSGDWPAAGCLIHVAFGDERNVRVSEVWESREQLQAFGEKLQPKLAAAGIQLAGGPEIFEALNVETL
jgi:hypothetical protein